MRLSVSNPLGRPWSHLGLLALTAVFLLAAGCGDDTPTEPIAPVDPEAAVPAASAAAQMQQIADAEKMLDAIESPLASAAGNFEGLGTIAGGSTELGDYWDNSKTLARAAEAVRRLNMARSLPTMRAAVERHPHEHGKEEVCETLGNITICVDEFDVNMVRVRITTVFGLLNPVASTEQVFEVDNNGTEEDTDDRISSFTSNTTHRNGMVIDSSILPVAPAEFIEDDVRVTLTEVVDFANGLVDRQTNSLTIDVADVETDGDEVIWSLSSVVDYFDGAQSSLTGTETPVSGEPDGVRDGDRVTLTASFTAAASNPRLESISADVVIWLGVVDDESDDLFERVSRTIVFDGTTQTGAQPAATVSYRPSEPVAEGEEPCSGTFSRQATFPADWETQSLTQNVTHDCETGGNATMIVSYLDDTTYTRTISWDGAGTATLSAAHRDGTTVEGTFDDNAHTFDVMTTFPDGHDPQTVEQSGSSNADTGARSYSIVATYADQSTESFDIASTRGEDGSRTITGSLTNAEGTVNFDQVWDPRTMTLTGSADGPQQQSLDYTLVGQEDGGALLDFVYANPAEDLTVTGDMVIYPDGSGCGTITIEQAGVSGTFPVCFDAEGRGSIQPLGASVIRW